MTATARRDPLVVVILIDALGWEIVERFGFCKRLLERAAPLDTVLGYSSAAIPSLLTGEPPSTHGAWAMYRYAPQSSPFGFLRYVPRLPHSLQWRLRVLAKKIVARRQSIRGYYDLYEIPPHLLSDFDIAQRGDPYTPGGMAHETLFDRLVADGVGFKTWTYRTPEALNFDALVDSVGSTERLLFLYSDVKLRRQDPRFAENLPALPVLSYQKALGPRIKRASTITGHVPVLRAQNRYVERDLSCQGPAGP